ncbi:MAG TPA: pyrroloquinoline quinone-dependent dehydrogenase [Bryobacteraceae bacterium]|jgi:quinoprotein glucose dehydrogenase|nr:pyrroloquinoline quinone-dependent dehydrogenase [Bryobacteraceae bacterium]
MRLTIFLIAALPLAAQNPADWPTYNRDLASSRFSPLTQITPANVSKLAQAWSYKMRPDADSPNSGTMNEVTPIVVNGVMYLPAGNRVIALDPETGKEVWRYDLPDKLIASQRGVAYWPGDKNNPPRVLFTAGHKMVALNAATGKLDPGFGAEGMMTMDVPWAGVPTVFRNMIFVGMNLFGPGEEHLHYQDEVAGGPPGDSRAYDARTGKKLWDFHAIPQPGEPNHNDWQGDSWKGRTGNNMWSYSMTVDEQRGIVYMPMGGPAANYYGGDRKGNNYYANSVVAVDANTGKLKWFFQTVHHELWDYDLPPDPVLIDIVKDGKKIPALAQAGKSGYLFILDRVTGKPVFGVEERKVPQSNVPTEATSPTQPFPLKPPPLARVSIKREDIVTADDTNADHAKACQDLWDKHGFQDSGTFTPWTYSESGPPSHETISFPGPTGGTNWGGAASDQKMGYIFVNSQDAPGVGWIRKNPDAGKEGQLPYDKAPGYFSFAAPAKDADGKSIGQLPCFKPPWERLFAVNANTGEIAWQVPLGITEGLPPGKRNTGRSGAFAGPIATAGGLVFIGATGDNRFRAFDSKTGREIWTVKLDYSATAVPITYQGKSGKQYVAVVSAGGGRGNNQALIAFALP